MSELHNLDIQDILYYLPHRYPFLLVDKVIHVEPKQQIHAIKNVTVNEPFFTGHFPGRPVMPGVLLLEALAQTAGILAYKSTDSKPGPDSQLLLAGIDHCRFKRVVIPGDQVNLHAKIIRLRREIWKFDCEAQVEGQLACSATILAAKRD